MSPQERVIDRIRKLYAKAESTKELGNEAEAMAFMEKVDELLTKYKLDGSVLTFDEREEADPMGQTIARGKGKSKRVAWIEHLAHYVTEAYFCQIVVMPGSDSFLVVGRETDRDIATYVIVKLVNFLEAECKRQHNKLRYRLYKENDGDMSEAHGFKASFYQSAVGRIRARLKELRQKHTAESEQYAVVLTQSRQELEDWMDKHMKTRTSTAVGGYRGGNAHGHARGREAGDRADLSGRGVQPGTKGGRKAIGGGS